MPATAELKTAKLPWTTIFAVGQHRDGERPWTADDLRAMVANWNLNRGKVEPPVVPGHEEFQALTASGVPGAEFLPPGTGFPENTGVFSLGAVTALRTDGRTLEAQFAEVPARFAELINARVYRWVSIEVYDEPPPGCAGTGPMLRRVAFLGGDLPQVKSLGEIPKAYFAEPSPPARWRLYSEARAMAESTTTDALIDILAAQPVQLTPEILKDMPPDTLAAIAKQVTPEGGTGTLPEETTAAEVPPDFDRASAIQAILAVDPAQDPAALEAMDDAALYALWLEKTGGTGATGDVTGMSEGEVPAVPTTLTPQAIQKFTEQSLASIKKAQAEFARQVAAEKAERARRVAAERTAARSAELVAARAYCEQLKRDGKVSPAECDGDPAKGILPLAETIGALPDPGTATKYAEGGKTFSLSPRAAFKRALDARKPRAYGEQIAVGQVNDEKKAFYEKLQADADARYAERRKNRGTPLAERLGLNRPAHRR